MFAAQEFGEYFKGGIPKWENNLVWSNAKISLNLHVVDGYGGWYVNQRTTEILGSKGLLLVDPAVEGKYNSGIALNDLYGAQDATSLCFLCVGVNFRAVPEYD